MSDSKTIAADILAFTSVDEDLAKVDRVQDNVSSIRQGVISKLQVMVDQINFEQSSDKMSEQTARLMPVTTLLSALKDEDSSMRDRAKLKLKHKDSEDTNNAAAIIAEFLRTSPTERLSKIGGPPDLSGITQDLEREIEASDNPIQEFETRMDPNDLT